MKFPSRSDADTANEPAEVSVFRHGAQPVAVPSRRVARAADVVVIGADNAGLAVATGLARAGEGVVLFTDKLIGDNASANGFGHMVRTPFLHDQLRRMQPERHEAIRLDLEAAFDWTASVAGGLGVDVDLEHRRSEATLDPFKFNQLLLSKALDAGVVVHQNTRVVRLDSDRRAGFTLRTSRGRLVAGRTVITDVVAMNSLAPALKASVKVDRRVMLGSVRTGDDLEADERRVQELQGALVRRLTSGTTVASAPPDKEALAAVAPLVGPVTNRWETQVAVSTDGLARVGEREGVWYVVPGAHDALAVEGYLGDKLADWMMEGEAPVFAELGFPQQSLLSRLFG